jgi:uncharacterized membrane protein
MHPSSIHYFPLGAVFFLLLTLALAAAVAFVEVGLLRYSYARMGIERRYVFALLLLSLLGSYVNIPIAELRAGQVVKKNEVTFFGMRYVVPVIEDAPRTILAVNVGGALVPTMLSIWLVVHHRLYLRALVAVVVVAAIVHQLAQPVPGVGIAVPTFVPPIFAALVAVVLSREAKAPLAYVAGSMGTLLGADLLNLDSLASMGASVASIGGAGTFDGVFLSGILAVLLAW